MGKIDYKYIMAYFYRLFAFFFLLLFLSGSQTATKQSFAVNSVLGDLSYIKRFGHPPRPFVSPQLRVQTHLNYVETALKATNIPHFPPALRKQRQHLLGLLKDYAQTGRFPQNFEYKNQSRPVFIDRNGNICAVGHLIAKTAGLALAQKLDQRFHNAYLKEMQDPQLQRWIKESGLSPQELAMIQPSYEPAPLPKNPEDPSVVIPSLSLDAVNLAVLLAYWIPIEDPTLYQGSRLGGMVIGGATVGWGLFNYGDLQGELSFKSHLSLANIGLGLATFLISYYQWQHPPQPNQPQTWTVGQYPSYASQTALGVNYQHRF